MHSSCIKHAWREISNMESFEQQLLLIYLAWVWDLPGLDPLPANFNYEPKEPLAGYLRHLKKRERYLIMRKMVHKLLDSCQYFCPN